MIVWITSLSDGHSHVKTPEQMLTSAEAQVQETRKEAQIEMEMDMERQDEVDEEWMPKDLCPETSPLLRESGGENALLAISFLNYYFFNLNSGHSQVP